MSIHKQTSMMGTMIGGIGQGNNFGANNIPGIKFSLALFSKIPSKNSVFIRKKSHIFREFNY